MCRCASAPASKFPFHVGYLSLVTIITLGLVVATYSTMNDTLIQSNVDDEYRGRVMASYSMLWGLSPIGGLLAGTCGVASTLDPRPRVVGVEPAGAASMRAALDAGGPVTVAGRWPGAASDVTSTPS